MTKYYPYIQFTIKKPKQALLFLDVYVQIRENELDLSV